MLVTGLVSPSVSRRLNILCQDVSSNPPISIGDYTLEVVEDFTYLGSTISSNLSLDTELNKRIGKAAAASTSRKEGLGQHHADHHHQDKGVPGLRAQHAPLRQRDLDPLLPPRAQTQHLPPALPQKDFGHHLARSSPKQGCPSTGGST